MNILNIILSIVLALLVFVDYRAGQELTEVQQALEVLNEHTQTN